MIVTRMDDSIQRFLKSVEPTSDEDVDIWMLSTSDKNGRPTSDPLPPNRPIAARLEAGMRNRGAGSTRGAFAAAAPLMAKAPF